MRVLVLGADGMLGSELVGQLTADHDVSATTRRRSPVCSQVAGLPAGRHVGGVEVRRFDDVVDAVAALRPDAVVNAVGLVKQRPDGQSRRPAIEVNALFPHRLAALCQAGGIRLVHVSTDCVFSGGPAFSGGSRRPYTEADQPDPVDVYGMSKLLGEVDGPGALTLRTSIVGLEPAGTRNGLVEWFLASTGEVAGFRRAVFSGLTTAELARLVGRVLARHPELRGVWHAANQPISKFDLLTSLAERLGRHDVTVVGVDDPVVDRSLAADRLLAETGYAPPPWPDLLDELAAQVVDRNRNRHRNRTRAASAASAASAVDAPLAARR